MPIMELVAIFPAFIYKLFSNHFQSIIVIAAISENCETIVCAPGEWCQETKEALAGFFRKTFISLLKF